jgi:hypothetical protein
VLFLCLWLFLLTHQPLSCRPHLPTCIFPQATLDSEPDLTPELLNSAVAGYTKALTASLQLLGPAVLHSYKHGVGSQGDPVVLPPGSIGCPVCDDSTPLTGLPVPDASLNLFGTLIVRLGATGEDSTADGASKVASVTPGDITPVCVHL